MIDAYYSLGSDSRELFSHFEIATKPSFTQHLNQYNVIHVDVSSMLDNYKGDVSERIWSIVYAEMKQQYPTLPDLSAPVTAVLYEVYLLSGRKFVIILDEWDCVVRNYSDRPDLVHTYLRFLHALFKSEEAKTYLALGYITGILPIKQVRDESAMNNFREFTMLKSNWLTPYFGFTEAEVKDLCTRYDMDFESVRTWYGGYRISDYHMYNPNSIYEAMIRHRLSSYWKNTSSVQTINDLISFNAEGLKEDILTMLEGRQVFVNVDTFQNDLTVIHSKNDALTALIHLGCLAYDAESAEAYIPNFEVSLAMQTALRTGEK